jgi:hypothetical protein
LPDCSATKDINGGIDPEDEECTLYMLQLTIAKNISRGTIIILHYWRVNSAADLITADAILIFLILQQRAIKDRPTKVQQT